MREKPEISPQKEEKDCPARREPIYMLEALLEKVTEENRHSEMDWGRA